MAKPGPKPKPPKLRIVDGTHRPTRHGPAAEIEKKTAAAEATFGKPVKPTYLKGHAAWAWKRYIEPAGWLDASREALAIAFCELWQEYRDGPRMFPAAKHGQLRAYQAELGLTDERNRGEADTGKDKDPFFND